jgi:hypothetical protein
MSKGNTKAQEMASTISAESVLIRRESNWIQTRFGLSGQSGLSCLFGLSRLFGLSGFLVERN